MNRTIPTRRFVPLLGLALLTSCGNTYRDYKLSMEKADLDQECAYKATNTCASKNIDFNIHVLEANTAERIVLFDDMRTPEQMQQVFGEAHYQLFKQSVDEVREQAIATLESHRPGWFSRWFLGDQMPARGVVPAFSGPGDLVAYKADIQRAFFRKLQAAGWQPTPEQLARYAPESTKKPTE